MSENIEQYGFKDSKCKKCGKEYPPYEVIKDGKVVNEGYFPDCECTVKIELKKWQIPILLGAASLGSIAEGWCARLRESIEEGFDIYDDQIDPEFFRFGNDSIRWQRFLKEILDNIKEQTSINLECMESADRDEFIDVIIDFVELEKERRITRYQRRLRELCKPLHTEMKKSWMWKRRLPGEENEQYFDKLEKDL